MSLTAVLLFAIVVAYVILRSSPKVSKPAFAGNGEFNVAVVGESHYQDALTKLCGGKTRDGANRAFVADVVPEDSNPYDRRAMRVDIQGHTVGYLSRDAALEWRNRHGDHGVRCDAVVRGGWDRGPKNQGLYGVWLRLPG